VTDFEQEVYDLLVEHGTTRFVVQALEEMGLKLVTDVASHSYFIKRCKALKEENG